MTTEESGRVAAREERGLPRSTLGQAVESEPGIQPNEGGVGGVEGRRAGERALAIEKVRQNREPRDGEGVVLRIGSAEADAVEEDEEDGAASGLSRPPAV